MHLVHLVTLTLTLNLVFAGIEVACNFPCCNSNLLWDCENFENVVLVMWILQCGVLIDTHLVLSKQAYDKQVRYQSGTRDA